MPQAKSGSENTKRIILFNGPPGSGKDTAASIVAKHIPNLVYQYKMALPLKEACHKLLGLQGTLEELEPLKEKDLRIPIKFPSLLDEKSGVQRSYESALVSLLGEKKLIKENWSETEDQKKLESTSMTLRQFYIHVSENLMKPLFGKRVFGKLAVEYIRQSHEAVTTISDSGFVDEAMPIIEYFGAEHVLLVRLHRPGKSFAGDSRSYVDLPVQTIDIENDKDMDAFEKCLWRKIHNNFLIGMF